ncbi:MAG: aminoglycoside phosphotransferase [Gemmatimonadota bacterium]
MNDLAALVAAAPGSLVLPGRPRAASVTVPTPLRLLAAFPLGERLAVAVVADSGGGRWTVPLVMGNGLRRARPGDGVAAALASALGSPGAAAPARADVAQTDVAQTDAAQAGAAQADAAQTGAAQTGVTQRDLPQGSSFSLMSWRGQPVTGEREVTVDQTNESVIAGDAAVVKWAVRLPTAGEPEQPAVSRLAALARAGFPGTPRPWGVLRWHCPDRPVALATVTSYLPGALDGWDWAVADVTALAMGGSTLARARRPVAELGRLTAGLHAALAAAGMDTGTQADGDRWWRRAEADLAEAATVGGPEGARLAVRAGALQAAFAGLRQAAGTPLIDVHGDLHVGQILRWAGPDGGHAYAVTDFDGNPVLPPADRARRAPAALDVAGMLASLDHVGRVVLHHEPGADADAVRGWITAAQQDFLAAYRAGLAAAGRPGLLDERLLWPLRLHQEVREYVYAIHHLPHWRYVPDAALADLLPADAPVPGCGPLPGTGPQPGAGPQLRAGPQPGTGPQPGAGAQPGAGPQPGTGPQPGAGALPGAGLAGAG